MLTREELSMHETSLWWKYGWFTAFREDNAREARYELLAVKENRKDLIAKT